MDGTVTTIGKTWTLTFERQLNHPIEKVWDALTNDARLKDWLAEDGTIDLRPGGRVELNDHGIASTIVDLDPSKVIEYGWKGKDWDGGTVRWELSETPSGTRLVLTHRLDVMTPEGAEEFKRKFPDLPEDWDPLASSLAGWHTILERFVAAADGAPIDFEMDRWKELNESYKVATAREGAP